jgi:N-acetylglucosaminyl-diphospho-decaprenol L-rhamnosyltransferase
MLVSIIIVNYNVKYFLEQCLCSVEAALRTKGLGLAGGESPDQDGAEIFVVDNNSGDGSAEWLPSKFPTVQFILNKKNLGFAAANNQALIRAEGKFILFLNPDTILPEDYFSICISFMQSTPGSGAVGARMVDGSGRFLKESRRGFPMPWVAFCKLSGLTAIFPRSRLFAEYYLGYLPEGDTHPAPVLSGACMFVRKQVLDQVGGFDERFFMYAEDIDLSHRIQQAGYTNYYIAKTTILHFKGESTKKDTRYVKLFYKAMSQFRRKHFPGALSGLINVLMEMAIWLRAGVTAFANLFRKVPFANKSPERWLWIAGDPAHANRLKAALVSMKIIIAPDQGQATDIILCEGDSFSFKQIIGCIILSGQEHRFRHGAAYKIHGAGTLSAVGSHSKDGQGDTILL